MFDKKPEDRLRAWVDFRNTLETSTTPLQDVVDFYRSAPIVNITVDPYDQKTWPTPWQLLNDNLYCDFAKVLEIAATLKLTDRFSDEETMIHIYTDREKSELKYLLVIDNNVIGYDNNKVVDISNISCNFKFDMSFDYTIQS